MTVGNSVRARRDRSRPWIVWAEGLFIAALIVTTAAIQSPGPERNQRASCMNNLSQLGQIFLMWRQAHPDATVPFNGTALWLSYRKDRSEIRRGDERVLICPKDDDASVPETDAERQAWDDVDLAHPSGALCSYASRDFERFPLGPHPADKEPIGACLHHKGIAIVVFRYGDAQKMTLEELGLASDDEKIVGPESKSPVLRVLKY